MKCSVCFFVLLIMTALLTACNAQNTNLDATHFAKGITGDSAQVLDVRTPEEYEGGHIKGALLADWNNETEFARRVGFMDKNKPVYVYCLGGGRSSCAAKQLRTIGFRQVYELQGGMNAWKQANQPIEGKTDAAQMSLEAFNAAIKAHNTVLVDVGAVWCPPCRKMEPVLNSLQTKYSNKFTLLKVDGGKDMDIMKAYNITALPVFILFKNGQQVWRKDGIADEAEIAKQF